jgi:hypothetical protein
MVKGTLWKVSQKKKMVTFRRFSFSFLFQIAKIFQGIGQILAFFLFKKSKNNKITIYN